MEKSSRAMEDANASLSSSPVMRRRVSYRALGSLSPRSGVVTYSSGTLCEHEQPYFLDACHLCRRPLSRCRDIFMYRGNMPFCSEECRQEQIELDEAREEEEASYWKSQSQRRGYGHRVSEPDVKASAEAQGIRPRAVDTLVAG